jgi:hypothetical protein
LRLNVIKTSPEGAAKEAVQKIVDTVQPEIKSCEMVQIRGVSAAQPGGTGPLSEELKTGLRQSPVTPLADHLLDWRQNLIRFARTLPICLPPKAKPDGAFPLSITAEFKVQTDNDPSLGVKIVAVSMTANRDTKSVTDNSITFYLSPVKPYHQ